MRWGGMHFDSGGVKFVYDENIVKYGLNYSSLAVAKFDVWKLNGQSGRLCLIWPGTDNQMLWQEWWNGYISTTVYDTGDSTWKEIGVDIESVYNKIMIYHSYFHDDIMGIEVYYPNGVLYSRKELSNILHPLTGSSNMVCVGSNADNGYKMCGDIYSVAIFDRVLDISDIHSIILNCNCEEVYEHVDGCIFACIFDRLKYGKPYDFINGVYGEPVDPNHPPRWNLMLTSDVGLEVLG